MSPFRIRVQRPLSHAEWLRVTGPQKPRQPDAVQAGGKIPLDLSRLPIDLLSLSAHKLHGPKGVGALYVRKDVKLSPIVFDGGQEQGLHSATENVAGIVGLGPQQRSP